MFIGSLMLFTFLVKAQNPAEEIANRIAQRMKDTLQLSDSQRVQIYNINMQLGQQKAAMRTQYSNADSLKKKIQLVENSRDGLYQSILSYEKYQLYIEKKKRLVNNN
jgi:hypothetical protein